MTQYGTKVSSTPRNTGVIRKAIKKRKIFPHDDAAKKVVYLAIMDASKRWSMPIRNWKAALNHFVIVFDGRLGEYL